MKLSQRCKRFSGAVLLVFVATAFAVGAEGEAEEGAGLSADNSESLQLALDLTDGSHVIGVPSDLSVKMQTSFAEMNVPFKKISSIQIDHKTGHASFSFMNGDKLNGELGIEAIEVKTLFGEFSIELEHIVTLYVLSDDLALPVSLRKGLMLYYSFNRPGSDGMVVDKSGKGNHGRVKGAKWTGKGVRGGAYAFSGKDDEITGSDLQLPSGDSARSVSLWFKFTADPIANGGTFIAWGTADRHNQYSSVGFDQRVNRYGVCFSQWGAVDVGSKKITKADEWHHVVFVYTGSGRTQFYVDGVDHGLQADEIRSPINTVPSGQLKIGGNAFDGQIGEVMIYDHALSKKEIDRIYSLQKKSFAP